jgi:DNA-binding HxlR family transcriptional regulator
MPRQQLLVPELLTHDILRLSKLLADAWSLKIIISLSLHQQRFSQLQRNTAISAKTLSRRLKELEKQALVTRTLYAQVPLRVEYELTEKGFEFKTLLDSFAKWDKKWT